MFDKLFKGELIEVTPEMPSMPWRGARDGRYFRCAICGSRLKAGDKFGALLTNTSEELTDGLSGNPFVCGTCFDADQGDRTRILMTLQTKRAQYAKLRDTLWFFIDKDAHKFAEEYHRQESKYG